MFYFCGLLFYYGSYLSVCLPLRRNCHSRQVSGQAEVKGSLRKSLWPKHGKESQCGGIMNRVARPKRDLPEIFSSRETIAIIVDALEALRGQLEFCLFYSYCLLFCYFSF